MGIAGVPSHHHRIVTTVVTTTDMPCMKAGAVVPAFSELAGVTVRPDVSEAFRVPALDSGEVRRWSKCGPSITRCAWSGTGCTSPCRRRTRRRATLHPRQRQASFLFASASWTGSPSEHVSNRNAFEGPLGSRALDTFRLASERENDVQAHSQNHGVAGGYELHARGSGARRTHHQADCHVLDLVVERNEGVAGALVGLLGGLQQLRRNLARASHPSSQSLASTSASGPLSTRSHSFMGLRKHLVCSRTRPTATTPLAGNSMFAEKCKNPLHEAAAGSGKQHLFHACPRGPLLHFHEERAPVFDEGE